MSLVPQPSETPPTASESLAQTLAIGNLTLANDIVVSNPQKIDFAGNISLRNNTGGGGTDVIINSIPPTVGPALTQGVFYDTATNKLYHQLQTNENLSQTLAIGNTTGANDIVISNPQKVSFIGPINLQGGVGADVIINAIPVAPAPQPVELCYDTATSKVYYQTPNTFNAGTGIAFAGPIANQTISNTGVLNVLAGAGLSASGTPPTGITVAMPNVGTAGTYTNPASITTDAQGRVSAITSGTSPSGPIAVSFTTGSGTYTVPGLPTDNYRCDYTAFGAGGGGCGGFYFVSAPAPGGGGGAGGDYVKSFTYVNGGDTITYSIGTGGAGGVSAGFGGSGSSTTFTFTSPTVVSTITLAGGNGALPPVAPPINPPGASGPYGGGGGGNFGAGGNSTASSPITPATAGGAFNGGNGASNNRGGVGDSIVGYCGGGAGGGFFGGIGGGGTNTAPGLNGGIGGGGGGGGGSCNGVGFTNSGGSGGPGLLSMTFTKLN